MKTTIIGIDIAKETFSICVMDTIGRVTNRIKVSRSRLMEVLTQLWRPCFVIAMESCGGSQYWAREFQSKGWKVRLIAAKFVKSFVKSQKNDAIDAEAICEACQRPRMRFVSVRTVNQQDVQCMVRVRSRLIRNRTALCNEIRGFLLEYGITVRQGVSTLRKQLVEIIEKNSPEHSELWGETFRDMYQQLVELDKRVDNYDRRLHQLVKTNETCERITTVPGIGPVTASALYAAVGDPSAFKNGRHFAAAMGLVPQQYSTGGRERLGRITKRGNKHLRVLLVQGAQSVVNAALRKERRGGRDVWAKNDATSCWIRNLYARAGRNKTIVAVANKTARRAWAVLYKKTDFIPTEEYLQAA